jgi:hypothetical protein
MSQSGILTTSGGGSGDVSTLTGNAGGAVGPNGAGNINIVGTGSVTITGSPGTNTLTVSISGSGLTWNVQTTNTTMAANNGYIPNSASLISLTLPLAVPFGTIVQVAGMGSGGWKIVQQAGQSIYIIGFNTTTGAAGFVESQFASDGVQLLCYDQAGTGLTWIALIVAGDPLYN